MYSPALLAFKYLRHFLSASNSKGHGMHSPFVFEFITKILNDNNKYEDYSQVEELRRRLLNDHTILNLQDLGAGSAITKTNQRSIASIARNAAKPVKFAQLLYRVVKYYQPAYILELGTSLGITSAYLSLANPGSKIVTMEGATSVAALAKDNFKTLELSNIRVVEGDFGNELSAVVNDLFTIDLAFIDGNHRLQPTIQYFETILPKTNNFSMIILDDIHWSDEMEQAWTYCKAHPSVTLSINLFFLGILIFRKEVREKQHFSIRF